MQLFGHDRQARISTCMPEVIKMETLPDNSISSDSKKDAIPAESLSCRSNWPPLVGLAKRCKVDHMRINDDPMLITLGTNPRIHRGSC